MIGLDDIFPAFVNFSFSWLVFLLRTLLSAVISSLFFLIYFILCSIFLCILACIFVIFWEFLVMWRMVRFSLFRFFFSFMSSKNLKLLSMLMCELLLVHSIRDAFQFSLMCLVMMIVSAIVVALLGDMLTFCVVFIFT